MAALLAVGAAGVIVAVRVEGQGERQGGPTAPSASIGSASPTVLPSTPASPSTGPSPSPSASAAACGAAHLTLSVDQAHTGPAAGIMYIVLVLRNTGAQPCRLAGFPQLSGVGRNGGATRLNLTHDNVPGVAVTSLGPGLLQPRHFGTIDLTFTDWPICHAAPASYARLRLTTADGASTETAFPTQMSVASCGGSQSEAGLYNTEQFGTPTR